MPGVRRRSERAETSGSEISASVLASESAHDHVVEEVPDIHMLVFDSTTIMALRMILTLLFGAFVLILLRGSGVAVGPSQVVVDAEDNSEGYTIQALRQDAGCFIHYVLGVILCCILQGHQGERSQHAPSEDSADAIPEPRKRGFYTWLLW